MLRRFSVIARNCPARRKTFLLSSVAIIGPAVLLAASGQALGQSIWGGSGSTTATANYNLGTNWSTNPVAPVAAGSSAVFNGFGSSLVDVTSPVTTNSWTFNTSSSSTYDTSGAAVTFSSATGLVNNNTAFSGPNIVENSLGGIGGVSANVGDLALNATNTYTGATTVGTVSGSIATLFAFAPNALGSNSAVTVNSGGTLSIGANQTIGSLAGSGIVTLTCSEGCAPASTLTVGTNGANTTFSGTITDGSIFDPTATLGLVKVGGGTLTLTGANSYGGGTTINGGTLTLGAGGTTGSIVGDVVNNGTLAINRSNAYDFYGVISGTGSFQQNGTGRTTLYNVNTYTGATTINAGTLALGTFFPDSSGPVTTGSIANSSQINLAGSTATFDISGINTTGTVITTLAGVAGSNLVLGSKSLTLSNASSTYAGTISGTGGLILTAGTEILTGNNTYTGGTTINGGMLVLGAGGTTGSIVGNVVDNGTFAINRSDIFVFGGAISGTGAFQQNGSGTTILTGANTYSGATTINAGTLALASGGSISATSSVSNSGTLDIGTAAANSGSLTSTGLVTNSATGTINVNGGGVMTAGGPLTNAGIITVAAGGLVSANAGSSNSAGATLNNFGSWVGAILNAGSLTTTGTITGGLTNSGTTNARGTLSGAIDNKGAGVFTVTGPLIASSSFTNEGAASLVVSGGNFTGITTLTNSSSATPGISIGAGRLLSAGLITNFSSATIDLANGSVLSSSTDIQNFGTIRTPIAGTSATITTGGAFNNGATGVINLQNGAATDRLTINGNYVGIPGSRIALDFNSQSNTADQVIITGNASGTTGLNVNNLTPGAPFTISPLLVQVNGTSTANFTLANAQNFGAVSVVALPQTNASGQSGISVATVPNASGLAGSIALTASQTLAFQSSDIVLDRLSEVREEQRKNAQGDSAPMAYAKMPVKADPIGAQIREPVAGPAFKPAMWVRGFGDFEDRTGQANFVFGGQNFGADLGYRQRSGGIMAGSDVVISRLTSAQDGLILGLLTGYLTSHVSLRSTPTTADFDGLTVGGYGTYFNGPFFTDLMVKFDGLSLGIHGPGVLQTADVKNTSLIANAGYKIDLPGKFYIEPTAGVDFVHTSFDHRSIAAAPQNVALANGEATRVRAGARIGTDWITNNIRIEPSLTGFAYEIVNASNAALFVNGAGLTLPSDQGKLRGELQAAVNFLNVQTGWSGFIRADTRFGDQLFAAGGRGGIRYQW